MASDDKEKGPLPPQVEKALAEARARAAGTAGALPGTKRARWLAMIPLSAAVVMLLLMMPRSAPPEDIPLPQIDHRTLRGIHDDDASRAAAARASRLPGAVLTVGTALRTLNRAQLEGASPQDAGVARVALEDAVRQVLGDPEAIDALRSLRAVQLETFLAEVARFEATGQPSTELGEVAGAFVERMSAAGWIVGRLVVPDDAQLRVAYKLVWNATVGADRIPGMALALDEQRVLYTLYLTHPHASEPQRPGFEARRRAAANDDECAQAVARERIGMEEWRSDKIKRLGEVDPTYPTAFALGISHYRARHFDLAMDAFRAWLVNHPDGPYSLRARNHMKAALVMYESP